MCAVLACVPHSDAYLTVRWAGRRTSRQTQCVCHWSPLIESGAMSARAFAIACVVVRTHTRTHTQSLLGRFVRARRSRFRTFVRFECVCLCFMCIMSACAHACANCAQWVRCCECVRVNFYWKRIGLSDCARRLNGNGQRTRGSAPLD